jgi:hypothetical protein
MKKSILIELRACINVDDYIFGKDCVENRINDYVKGLQSFFDKMGDNTECDIVFVENTYVCEKNLPKEILDVIPEGTFLFVKLKNYYGKINKGSGLIEMWKEYLDQICEYDYFFYYEPRMILEDSSFLQSFLDNPRNYFCVEDNTEFPAVKTGYFGAKVKDLKEYCDSIDLEKFTDDGIHIENSMRSFFEKKDTDFQKDIKYCIRRWYDNFGGFGYGRY